MQFIMELHVKISNCGNSSSLAQAMFAGAEAQAPLPESWCRGQLLETSIFGAGETSSPRLKSSRRKLTCAGASPGCCLRLATLGRFAAEAPLAPEPPAAAPPASPSAPDGFLRRFLGLGSRLSISSPVCT